MIVGIIAVIVVVVATLIALGLTRIDFPRTPGLEGVEDLDAARAYDRISRWPQFRLIRRMFVRKLSKYQPSGILVDIGCGPGYLTTLIAQRYRHLHIVGLDAADEMIRTATSNVCSLGLSERIEFRQGDVGHLPMVDGILDFAVSTFSLHHWSDPDLGLAEIERVLKPGGQLLLFDFRRDARRLLYWLLRFAQEVIVPAGLRNVNEPLGSLLSSYTTAETDGLFARSPFTDWSIECGAGWMFAWARKGSVKEV